MSSMLRQDVVPRLADGRETKDAFSHVTRDIVTA